MQIQVNSTSLDITSVSALPAVYNCLVDVITVTKTNSSLGPSEVLTTLVASMPCNIEWEKSGEKLLSSGERILHDKITYVRHAVINCRKPAGITITIENRILYLGTYYDIVDVVDFNNLGTLYIISIKKME